MKILLSAYACEPHRGSEPGVGWHWAVELARLGHHVHVLTRSNNRPVIEAELLNLGSSYFLDFTYFDLPPWLRFWKKLPAGIYAYYLFWQIGAWAVAKRLIQTRTFDLVHHITFVSIHQPSFMGNLGIPFVFGPVAGGDRIPWQLRNSLPFAGKFRDLLRDIKNSLLRFDPLMRQTFNSATHIVVTSEQTRQLIPAKYHRKSRIHLAVGAQPFCEFPEDVQKPSSMFRVLFCGRLLYLKGIHLALRAFAQFNIGNPDSEFLIVGSGPDEAWLKRISSNLGIEASVRWVSSVPKEQMAAVYRSSDVLLFPSLRDSGGMVVLEAIACGVPVICLNLGGPGMMVDSTCGIRIEVVARSETAVIEDMAQNLARLERDRELLETLKDGCRTRIAHLSWNQQVRTLYEELDRANTKSSRACHSAPSHT